MHTPPTVTILQQDPSSVAKSMASVDTDQVIQQSLEAPVSNLLNPTTPVFTHSVLISGYEATEIPNDGTSVFYMSKDPSNTNWGDMPSEAIVAEVTTVTVLPVPKSSATFHRDTDLSISAHGSFSRPPGGWNGTNATSWGSGAGLGAASSEVPASTLTLTHTIYAVTQSVVMTAAPTFGSGTPDYGYGSPDVWVEYDVVEKRQTCVWITATIGGQEVGWCNNWAGGSTLTFTSWETTAPPSYIPGINTIGKASTAASSPDQLSSSVDSFFETSSTVPIYGSSTPSPTACGEVGPFQIGFDELPVFSPADNNTAPFPPIFNPYDHFFWGDGWAYVPPPNEPYPPQSGNRLAQFIPSQANNITGSPYTGLIPPSSLGAGPRNYDNRYWFTASSAYVGCDNGATNWSTVCDFVATAYRWDNPTGSEVVVATQHFRIPPCPNFKNCQLTKIIFNHLFYKLSTLSFYANVQGQVGIFWVDSLDMNWYNNTCAAGLARISSRKIRT
ncbi:uncharacterized protein Z518_04883 [Rhinocladiella mackenziei CBS 650.93]|uniref:DUF7371 domain-containing protein n=1 Tax=Rhinocladiella mackenziei CBS 650.93 TaxID=1442369 RepID=A0A0D2FX39_9EURO|nr:uncharacterized protein Z518_04883 [Rhinocladiella mackenziei CBS 650.93]KIX06907.1 hypothetical protein Z518_04883 [Rhinocladiella mackenziei CBS 650.93]